MAIKLKQLDIDPNGKQANYPEYKYPTDVRNPNSAPLPEWVDPLGYNPNPMKSTDTNINNTAELSEGQRLQQNDAVVFNNNKRQNYANADNGMPGGVIPATETPAQRSDKIFQQNHGGVTVSGLVNGNGVYEYNGVPTQAPTGYTDINALTDRLRQQQEAERAKFERKRMADRISRMGFALGNLIGAKGGSTDASAITLDDGTKTVNEYRKDMEDINKQNEDAYKRALELINDEYTRQYNADKLAADIEKAKATLTETNRHNTVLEDIYRGRDEEKGRSNLVKEDQNQQKINQTQQKIGQTQQRIGIASGNLGARKDKLDFDIWKWNNPQTTNTSVTSTNEFGDQTTRSTVRTPQSTQYTGRGGGNQQQGGQKQDGRGFVNGEKKEEKTTTTRNGRQFGKRNK